MPNRDILKGNWKQLSGEIKQRWGQLTDDDLARSEGNRDKLIGALQERYGYERAQAANEVDAFINEVSNRISTGA